MKDINEYTIKELQSAIDLKRGDLEKKREFNLYINSLKDAIWLTNGLMYVKINEWDISNEDEVRVDSRIHSSYSPDRFTFPVKELMIELENPYLNIILTNETMDWKIVNDANVQELETIIKFVKR